MATVDVLSQEKKKVGTIDLSDDVFGVKVNIALVHQVIKAQLAGRRAGNAKTKTKAEVRGGGKKPYKQKGTGNARQGSIRSSQFVGGGAAHGPQPRDYTQATPKKMAAGALRSALSDRLLSERLLVIDQFEVQGAKTKALNLIFSKNLGLANVLVIDQPATKAKKSDLERSGRNLKGIKVLRSEGLNVYDIVKHEWLILTKSAVQAVEKRLTSQKEQ